MMFGRKDRKMNEYQNALVEQHYAEIENIYRTMRGWKHDWHNHIQALSAQLDSGEYKKARSYLDEINQSILTIDTVIKTGNTMADAILNSKISLMKSKEIEVEAQAQVPCPMWISASSSGTSWTTPWKHAPSWSRGTVSCISTFM